MPKSTFTTAAAVCVLLIIQSALPIKASTEETGDEGSIEDYQIFKRCKSECRDIANRCKMTSPLCYGRMVYCRDQGSSRAQCEADFRCCVASCLIDTSGEEHMIESFPTLFDDCFVDKKPSSSRVKGLFGPRYNNLY